MPNFADEIVVECPKIIEPDVMARVAAIRAKAAPRVTAPRTTNSPVLLGGLAKCGHAGCDAGMVIRSGKGGQYRYYVCNNKATAGADICPGKSIREDALDSIVLDGLLHRVLAPDRLRVLLADVLDRSDVARRRREKDLDRVRRERIGAETRLRRLLEIVEEGMMSVRDPIFATKLAEANASIAALSETEHSLAGQLGSASNQITDEAIQRFGEALRANIMAENSAMRRAYVRLLVSNVTVNDNEITIAGSKAALENAAQKGDPANCAAVPSFDRKWCQKRDRDVSPKRYITMLYCDFSNFDTVENTVLALALVLNEDSNRCGRSISDQSATPKFILRPADNFLPENGEKPNQAAPNEAAMAGAISAASCCTTAPLPTNRSTLAIRRRSSPSIMP